MLENVYPLNKSADILILICNRSDWHDYNTINGYTYGYCANNYPASFPPLISLMVEENDYTWYSTNISALNGYVPHEIAHGLYNICGMNDQVHQLDYFGKTQEMYDGFDYTKINFALNNKRNLNEPMYVFQKDGAPELYFAVGKVLVPFSNTYEGFLADFKDAIIVKLLPDEFLKFKIANHNIVKAR